MPCRIFGLLFLVEFRCAPGFSGVQVCTRFLVGFRCAPRFQRGSGVHQVFSGVQVCTRFLMGFKWLVCPENVSHLLNDERRARYVFVSWPRVWFVYFPCRKSGRQDVSVQTAASCAWY